AYYDILSAQRIHEIALSDVERLTAFRDSVVEKLNVGNVTRTDLYRAEAELSKALTEEVVSQNNILKNKAVLRNLVDVDDEYDLEKETLDGIESYRFELDDIQSTALKMRAEIKEAKKNYIIAEKAVDFNKGDYWPTLSFEAGYTEVDTEYPMDGGFDFENNEDDIYISGELVFTLYDGGLRKATVRQAVAEQRQAKNALELAEKEVILESKNAFYDYESSQRALVNLEDELKSAQETYNAVQMQLQYGMADYLDVVDANTLLVSAQRRKTDAQYTYYLSVLRILYTKGELLEFLSSRKS
ncbi:MAG: TolC family protein, partial [Desulfobacterales bacterium]|nr:TolC family protein [Desulfobacterales bacterium]